METEIVNFGAGELEFVADTDIFCYTIVSVHVFCMVDQNVNITSVRISV